MKLNTYSNNNTETNMVHIFDGCKNIKMIDISHFTVNDPSKVESMFDNIYNNVTIIANQNCLNNYKKILSKKIFMLKKSNNFIKI